MSAKLKIFLALPIYQDVSPLFANCLLHLMAAPPCEMEMAQDLCNPWIQNSRNGLTGGFLESDCTHILFLDSDMLPSPDHIKTLMSRNVPIVGAMYAKKTDGPVQWALSGFDDEESHTLGPLMQVKYLGPGCVLIARCVFEKMIEALGDVMRYEAGSSRDAAVEYDFWSQGIYPRPLNSKWTWLGEDWYFCQRANDCGFRVWADTTVIVPHVGRAIYPMKHQRENAQLFKQVQAKQPEPQPEPVTINQG